MNSDPGPTNISVSDDDSGFAESSDTCVLQNEAEPGTDQQLSVPYDVDFNANDNAGKTLSDDETHVQLNGVVSDKNADMVMDVVLNGIDKAIEPIGLDDSAKSFDYFNDDQSRGFDKENEHPDGTELAPDGTWEDMQTLMDGKVKDVIGNECQDPMTHVIDELDILFSTEMSVKTEKDKEKMAEKIQVDVDVNSTPQSPMYVSQDNTFINDYGQFERFSSVCNMNNDVKYTVGADGLIFGGPNILASRLDGCTKTNWKKVQVWKAEDTWSYVGGGMSVTNRSIETDFYELPMVEKTLDMETKKRKLDCGTGKQLHKR